MYPLKEWIWLRRLCPKKTENFTKRLKLKFLRIIHTIKTFFLQEDICCFTVLNLRELRYILPISQEGSVYVEDILDKGLVFKDPSYVVFISSLANLPFQLP